MEKGFLAVETHRDRPGMVRLLNLPYLPETASGGTAPTRVCFAARFSDRDAALMHTHEILKRRLVDPDARLYRAAPEDVIGAIESLSLTHHDVYLDPDFDNASRRRIEATRQRITYQRKRTEKIFQTIGYIGIAILLFNFFVFSIA